jgi:1-pyrroline-5-carboxylate dehydrogenase
MLSPFQNESLTDFSQPENRQAMQDALASVREQFGKKYPIIIDGEEVYLEDTFNSVNPSRPDETIGVLSKATPQHATQAIEVAHEAFDQWRRTSIEKRADLLVNVAAHMRERKHEFSAWMVYELGKSWPEADGDTRECIDFLEYYARAIFELQRVEKEWPEIAAKLPGERSAYRYIPLGVGVVIPPWNFGALLTGMTSGALVAGNTVVLKPASNSPVVSFQITRLFYDAGIPPGVLNFITGPGSTVGEALVDHPKTRFISFTGSKEVGIRINERAAIVHPGQIGLKRTLLEMGGKDAVVVDETADLGAAVEGVVQSAFGYQGQKCAAGSRVIAVEAIYDDLIERVVRRTEQITVGDPSEPGNWMGPVIDAEALKKIMRYIEIGKEQGELTLGGETLEIHGGYFLQPTIFKDVPWDASIAQEEIFGPVLAVIKAKDFDDALRIANATEYGLTGALYTAPGNHERKKRVAEDFHVGNLYINRPCTGSIVGVHPFGGFKMSGTDSKAGGPDYLRLLTLPKSIGERL